MGSAIIIPPKPALLAEDCCGRCKHMHELQTMPPSYLCRRNPPVPYPVIAMTEQGPVQAGCVSNFPNVLPEQSCGEFKRKIHHGNASAS